MPKSIFIYDQTSTGRNTFSMCSDIVTRFWCYLDIKLTILTVSHNICWFLAIFVLNHLVILLSTTAAGVTIVDHFDVKNPFLYSNLKASPDLGVNFPQKLLILAFLTNFWWFWIWTIWQRCRNGQNYQISQCPQIWMWISPKIPKNCQFWRFWPILGKKRYGTSGDNVRTQ